MEKKIVMASDFSALTLKEAVKAHLQEQGWEVTDIGTLSENERVDYHKAGFAAGRAVSEGKFERGIVFCGSGMGVHLAACKWPGVNCAVVESAEAARQCRVINNCNMLAMGRNFISDEVGCAAADAFLNTEFLEGCDGFLAEFLGKAYTELEEMQKAIFE